MCATVTSSLREKISAALSISPAGADGGRNVPYHTCAVMQTDQIGSDGVDQLSVPQIKFGSYEPRRLFIACCLIRQFLRGVSF